MSIKKYFIFIGKKLKNLALESKIKIFILQKHQEQNSYPKSKYFIPEYYFLVIYSYMTFLWALISSDPDRSWEYPWESVELLMPWCHQWPQCSLLGTRGHGQQGLVPHSDQNNLFVWGKRWSSGKHHPVELWERGVCLVTPRGSQQGKLWNTSVPRGSPRSTADLILLSSLLMSLPGPGWSCSWFLQCKIREESWLDGSLGITSCMWKQKCFFAFFSSFKCPLEFHCEKSVMKIESVKGGNVSFGLWFAVN